MIEIAPVAQVRNAFSVDLEDYFHVGAFEGVVQRSEWPSFESRVERNTHRLLDLFERYDIRSTFFVLGCVAEGAPALIREIQSAGHELAIHGYDHRRITDQTPEEFREDVAKAKRIVEDIAGVRTIGYRAPNYSVVSQTLWALDILLEEGFRYDSSIFPVIHDRYGIRHAPRFPWRVRQSGTSELIEFPVSTVRLLGINIPIAGGGYLRHFPLWFILRGLDRVNRVDRQPVAFYIHPWELDPDQPRQPVSLVTRLRHYRNLGSVEGRLERIFQRFSFSTMREVLEL